MIRVMKLDLNRKPKTTMFKLINLSVFVYFMLFSIKPEHGKVEKLSRSM